MMDLLCRHKEEILLKHVHMIVKYGICPYCKKAAEFDINKCRCPGCNKEVAFDEIIEDE